MFVKHVKQNSFIWVWKAARLHHTLENAEVFLEILERLKAAGPAYQNYSWIGCIIFLSFSIWTPQMQRPSKKMAQPTLLQKCESERNGGTTASGNEMYKAAYWGTPLTKRVCTSNKVPLFILDAKGRFQQTSTLCIAHSKGRRGTKNKDSMKE